MSRWFGLVGFSRPAASRVRVKLRDLKLPVKRKVELRHSEIMPKRYPSTRFVKQSPVLSADDES
jgi:hypothetical protein